MTYQLILSLKSFEPKLIENYLKNVQSLAHKLKNEQLVGRSVSSLRNTGASPTKIRKITVLSSPHIDKKAREQFEMRVFQKHLRVDTFSTFLEFFLFVDLFKALHLSVYKANSSFKHEPNFKIKNTKGGI